MDTSISSRPSGREPPACQHKLTILRDRSTPPDLQELVERSPCLAYEATIDIPLEDVRVETPLEPTVGHQLSGKKLTLVPILRAGLGMVDGIYRLVPNARIGHIGLYRNHDTLEPVDYYFKVPGDAPERDFFVLDPMLATGGRAAGRHVTQARWRHRAFRSCAGGRARRLCAVSHRSTPDVMVYCAALDRDLNGRGTSCPARRAGTVYSERGDFDVAHPNHSLGQSRCCRAARVPTAASSRPPSRS